MILVYLLAVSVLVGYLRGGRLSGYLQKPLRGLFWPVAAFCLEAAFGLLEQLIPGEPQCWLWAAVLIEYACLFIFLFLNRDEPALWLVAAGTALNLCAMACHRMRMPVSPAALDIKALEGFIVRVESGELMEYVMVDWNAPLWWLGDTIPIPWGIPGVASVGDFFMGAGIFGWTQAMMLRGRKPEASGEEMAESRCEDKTKTSA